VVAFVDGRSPTNKGNPLPFNQGNIFEGLTCKTVEAQVVVFAHQVIPGILFPLCNGAYYQRIKVYLYSVVGVKVTCICSVSIHFTILEQGAEKGQTIFVN